MDPVVVGLGAQLADVALRNAASSVADRIGAVKVRKDDKATIALLEDLVNELVADKAELTRIAQAYQQEVGAKQISPRDIEYIATNLRGLIEKVGAFAPGGASDAEALLDAIEPFLSAETLTVVQLMGFNVREAVGEPMTVLVRDLISTRLGGAVAPGKAGQRQSGRR